ncbi:MAG: alanyl-tRNA editing protein, partial [Lachnospiraceae bacterium]|nr:alanyl-tRNA editing protein [Lachnospiraceae bacterium]
MTEKLYDTDVYCREFDARVMDCSGGKDGWEIILDRSAFYPEGGGQPGDRGSLMPVKKAGQAEEADRSEENGRIAEADPTAGAGRIAEANSTAGAGRIAEADPTAGAGRITVTDTHEKEGSIVLYTDHPLEPGTAVRGIVDWDYRFDLMQNHSGEHIVSGLIHETYGYNNVGFHMGSDMLTVDLDGEFSFEEMQEIERRANRIVWENQSTGIRTYSEEEVKSVEYRSKKELHGEVRIVTFPGADTCACCGTHVSHAGEIGPIKLISLEKFKGGVRMGMLCGRRAMEYMNTIWEQNHQISMALSAKPFQTADAVRRLKESDAANTYRLNAMENQM